MEGGEGLNLASVSRRICRIGGMILTLKILIPDDKPVCGKRVWDDKYEYELNLPAFLTLSLLLPFDGFARKTVGNITLTEVGRIEFIALARKMVKVVQTEDIFYDDPDEGLSVYKNLDANGISRFLVSGKVGKDYIALHPDVFIEEDNHIRTEGIRITIAKNNATIVVTYTDMLIMLEVLKDINISTLSQLLYMTFMNEIQHQDNRSNEAKAFDFKTHSRLDELVSNSGSKLEEFKNVRTNQKIS
jgi:hypothetical protein